MAAPIDSATVKRPSDICPAMTKMSIERGDRVVSAIAAAVLPALLVWLLVVALAPRWSPLPDHALKLFGIVPPPPPIGHVAPPTTRGHRVKDSPAPPNLRAVATPIVAPTPIVAVPVPPPVVTAPVANVGAAPTSGAAEIAGPGTGAGGEGNGTGGGGNGDGGGRDDTPPRQIKGRLRYADLPRTDDEASPSGTVWVKYLVEVDGRVPECRVTRSSGNRMLDETTCRLIIERFRFRPALDEDGRPVPSWLVEYHAWGVEDEDPDRR